MKSLEGISEKVWGGLESFVAGRKFVGVKSSGEQRDTEDVPGTPGGGIHFFKVSWCKRIMWCSRGIWVKWSRV